MRRRFRSRSFVLLLVVLPFVAISSRGARAESTTPSTYAPWNLLESPYTPAEEGQPALSTILCTLAFPAGTSMYGLDVIDPAAPSKLLIANELFAPFRVFEFDEACSPISTYSTAFSSTTMSGVLVDNGNTTAYWAVNPAVPELAQYARGTGAPTGLTVPLPPTGGFYGDGVVDSNLAGDVAFVVDFVNDIVVSVDLATGAFVCSFTNPDAPSAFGQGIGDVPPGTAATRSNCILPSGVPADGRPVRISRIDCFGSDDGGCDGYGAIDLTKSLPGSAFVVGVASFLSGGTQEVLAVVDNTAQVAHVIAPGAGGLFGSGCARPSPGPNGWWHLDETSGTTSADEAVCSDGMHVGAPVPTPGQVSGCLSFSGTDAVVVPHQPCLDFGAGILAFNSSSFTIEAWIQTSSSGPQSIIRKISSTTDGFNFRLVGGVPHLTMDITKGIGAPSAIQTYPATTFVADGDWHHVAVVVRRGFFGGMQGTFYVDGVAEAPFTPLIGTVDSTTDVRIGGKFMGLIDEVSIYGYPLPACDIERIYAAGSNGKCR